MPRARLEFGCTCRGFAGCRFDAGANGHNSYMIEIAYRVECPACHHDSAEVNIAYPYAEAGRNRTPVITIFRCVHEHAAWHVPSPDAELFDLLPDNAFAGGYQPAWWLRPSKR